MVVTTFMFSAMDGVSRYLAENNNVLHLVTMRYWFIPNYDDTMSYY